MTLFESFSCPAVLPQMFSFFLLPTPKHEGPVLVPSSHFGEILVVGTGGF